MSKVVSIAGYTKFPKPGDYFYARAIIENNEMCIFELCICTASDSGTVIAKVDPLKPDAVTFTFKRNLWKFLPADERVLQSLGLNCPGEFRYSMLFTEHELITLSELSTLDPKDPLHTKELLLLADRAAVLLDTYRNFS